MYEKELSEVMMVVMTMRLPVYVEDFRKHENWCDDGNAFRDEDRYMGLF